MFPRKERVQLTEWNHEDVSEALQSLLGKVGGILKQVNLNNIVRMRVLLHSNGYRGCVCCSFFVIYRQCKVVLSLSVKMCVQDV